MSAQRYSRSYDGMETNSYGGWVSHADHIEEVQDLRVANVLLENENERLKAALKQISANPYWVSCAKYAADYWQRYNNIVRIADEATKEPDLNKQPAFDDSLPFMGE